MTALTLSFDSPAQRHSKTSKGAAESIKPSAGTLRAIVLDYLRKVGDATDEEMQLGIPMPANTQRPRRRELEIAGLIEDSGHTRHTSSGRSATVWRAR